MTPLGDFDFDRKLWHQEKTADGKGWRIVQDGTEKVTIRVEYDRERLASAVSGAAQNKSGVARYLGGALVGIVIKRRKL